MLASRQLPWRKLSNSALERTVVICPTDEFIAGLPHAKVPNRQDFVDFAAEDRIAMWRTVVTRCEELADELTEVLERDLLPERLQVIQ